LTGKLPGDKENSQRTYTALRAPLTTVMYNINLETSDCTSGIRHWGLSEFKRTGVKVNEGFSVAFSTRY